MYMITIGEIFLKGNNRYIFQRRLIDNVKSALNIDSSKIKDLRNRIIIFSDDCSNLKYVFGINSYFKVVECSFDDINDTALSFIKDHKSFRISASRLTKNYKPSHDIQKDVGSFIVDKKNIKVDLHNPDINIHIEIINDKAYVFDKIIPCLGGLPVGSSGSVFIEVVDEIKSCVASFLIMKRGCKIVLSKDIILVHKFIHGFKLNIRNKLNNDIIVKDDLVFDINDSDPSILRPLVGYSVDEVNELYNKIKDL